MTKQEINAKLKEILAIDDTASIISEGKELLVAYQSTVALIHKEQLEKFIDEGGLKEDFAPRRDDDDISFDDLWTKFSQRKKNWEDQVKQAQEDNLQKKEAIIDAIKAITDSEENIKEAMIKVKELEEKWKEIGNVSPHKYKDLQSVYSRTRDEFYYNIRIHRELLEHDLKRNLQLKEELAAKMEELSNSKNAKELESLARTLVIEWDEIGPTFRDKWEEVRDRFKDAQRKVYETIKEHYKSIRDLHAENLTKKEELCAKLEEILKPDIQSEKLWKKLTDEVIQIQKEWKGIGFATKKENDKVWARFKEAGDNFFESKSTFYQKLKAGQDKNRDLKKALVEEAESLKENENWKETSDRLVFLQKKWQKIGNAHQRDEQRLWKAFRAACNAFFENKKQFYSTIDERQAENLTAKQAVIDEIKSIEISGDSNLDKASLKELSSKFNAIGFVPLKDKNSITDAYRKALEEKYVAIGINKDQIVNMQYRNKLEDINSSDSSSKSLDREERNLREKIKKVQSTIQQYENNLGFFGNSKGAASLLKEAELKLTQTKEQLKQLESKLKIIQSVRNEK